MTDNLGHSVTAPGIAQFVADRLDEAEATAKDVTGELAKVGYNPWLTFDLRSTVGDVTTIRAVRIYDPAAALGVVAALHLIAGHHRPILRFVSVRGGDWQWLEGAAAIEQVRTGEVFNGRLECHVCGEEEGGGENPRLPWPCPTITALASMWVGHPDYDTTWEQG